MGYFMATNHLRTIDTLKKEIEKLKIEKSDLALELGKTQVLLEIEKRENAKKDGTGIRPVFTHQTICDDYTIKELMRREEEKQ